MSLESPCGEGLKTHSFLPGFFCLFLQPIVLLSPEMSLLKMVLRREIACTNLVALETCDAWSYIFNGSLPHNITELTSPLNYGFWVVAIYHPGWWDQQYGNSNSWVSKWPLFLSGCKMMRVGKDTNRSLVSLKSSTQSLVHLAWRKQCGIFTPSRKPENLLCIQGYFLLKSTWGFKCLLGISITSFSPFLVFLFILFLLLLGHVVRLLWRQCKVGGAGRAICGR